LIDERAKNKLIKQHYRLVGEHSAVKLCHWTKKSLLDEGFCYKQKFYGIQTHRCLQMTPAVLWCNQRCIFCWRRIEETLGADMLNVELDEPSDIIDKAEEGQRLLLTGYGGIPYRVNQRKLREAQQPNQAAISLSGEPTLYPGISDLVAEFKKRNYSTFLVSNGTQPNRLGNMDCLPTQLYISLEASNRMLHQKICNPIYSGAWDDINKTLSLLPSLDTRTVIRITAIKGFNMIDAPGYARLIEKAQPDYVEVKAFMLVGGSRERLTLDNMPSHDEIESFARELANELSYKVKDRKKDSRVVLLTKK